MNQPPGAEKFNRIFISQKRENEGLETNICEQIKYDSSTSL